MSTHIGRMQGELPPGHEVTSGFVKYRIYATAWGGRLVPGGKRAVHYEWTLDAIDKDGNYSTDAWTFPLWQYAVEALPGFARILPLDGRQAPVLEVKVHNTWHKVSEWIFRSWTGPRRKDGQSYEGPVYYLGTDEVTRS